MPLRGVKLLRSEILLRRVSDKFHFTFREIAKQSFIKKQYEPSHIPTIPAAPVLLLF